MNQPNQPMERTPPCCALRCRSSARWAAKSLWVPIPFLRMAYEYENLQSARH